MSKSPIQAFVDKVQEDKDLQDELRKASGEHGIPAQVLTKIAADRGYEFAVEDLSKELDEAELDAVAGGIRRTTSMTAMKYYEFQSYMPSSGGVYYKISF